MEESKNASVTQADKGFTISASPFNPVKFDLGVILILAIGIWLLVGVVTSQALIQILIMFSYGISSMIWLVLKIRRIYRQQMTLQETHGEEK
ncbi:MAG: hypothetical protein OEZ58_08685 [Gammaproteobacteria bacterium]|nr:hypothetical protein [Gammaproteobacteria bacterium]MDH5729053.1 hypothetical protein [Gammaproteobacteria bacterium]